MLPRCCSKMRQMVPLISLCVIRHVSIPHWLCLFIRTDEKTSRPSRDFPPLSRVFKELQQHFFLLRDLPHFLVKVFVSDSDAECQRCKPLCRVVLSFPEPRDPSAGGADAHFDKWGTHREGGTLIEFVHLELSLTFSPCTVEIRLPIHAAF